LPEASAVPNNAFVDAALALDELSERLFVVLLHFHVSKHSPGPLARRVLYAVGKEGAIEGAVAKSIARQSG
jgi:hypothetical protein